MEYEKEIVIIQQETPAEFSVSKCREEKESGKTHRIRSVLARTNYAVIM